MKKCRKRYTEIENSKKRGITLISLVVTIIILLILAGVTLALISGSDGILGRATHAVDENKKAMAKEQVELAVGDFQTEFFDVKYVERTNNGGKKEYISDKLMAGVETADFFAVATEDGMVNVYDIGKVQSGKEVVVGVLENDGSINWDGKQMADPGNQNDLQQQVNELKKQVENLSTTVSLLQNTKTGKTKLIKRDWDLASQAVAPNKATTLESVSLKGNGTGKAVISFSVSTENNVLIDLLATIETNQNANIIESADISWPATTSGGRALMASPSITINYSEDTIVHFVQNNDASAAFTPAYSYSILLIPDE